MKIKNAVVATLLAIANLTCLSAVRAQCIQLSPNPNTGTITNTSSNACNGTTFTNTGGTVLNYGSIDNLHNSKFANKSGGVLSNYSGGKIQGASVSLIENDATSTINNYAGGTIITYAHPQSIISNNGYLINDGYINNGGNLTNSGIITNNGTISTGTQLWNGYGGTLINNTNASLNVSYGNFYNAYSNSVTHNYGSFYIAKWPSAGFENNGTFYNYQTGSISNYSILKSTGSFYNYGTISTEGQWGGGYNFSGYLENLGTISSVSGATNSKFSNLVNSGLINSVGNTSIGSAINLSGGIININSGINNISNFGNNSTLRTFSNYGVVNITHSDGQLGNGSYFTNYQGGTLNNNGKFNNANLVQNFAGGSIVNNGTLTNTSTSSQLIIDKNSFLTGTGSFIQNLGETTVNGSASQTLFRINGGRLQGDGTIEGDVTISGGTLAPGNSPGTLTINGGLQFISGVLDFEIADGAFDLLSINGSASFLSGTLAISFLDGFLPTGSNSWIFLTTTGALTGWQNLVLSVSGLNADYTWFISKVNNGLVFNLAEVIVPVIDPPPVIDLPPIAAVPEPETYAMMLAGLGLLGVFARRRKQKAVA